MNWLTVNTSGILILLRQVNCRLAARVTASLEVTALLLRGALSWFRCLADGHLTSLRPDGSGMDNVIVVPPPFHSCEEARVELWDLANKLRRGRDRRAVFAAAYAVMTEEIMNRVREGFFSDSRWVEELIVVFANHYREAFEDYERDRRRAIPMAWYLSFDASLVGQGLIIQDLMLAMNAHINYDLPFALVHVGIDDDRPLRLRDYGRINEVLSDTICQIQHRVLALYSPSLVLIDRLFGSVGGWITRAAIQRARRRAMAWAISLAEARCAAKRQRVACQIAARAAAIGNLILLPNRFGSRLVKFCSDLSKERQIAAPAHERSPARMVSRISIPTRSD